MPNIQNLCYNCFSENQDIAGTCPYCGYDNIENREKYPTALKAGSILNGQYIVGRVLGQGGFGITYLALDYQLKIKVAIKEYIPDGMATRLPDTTLVSVYVGEKQDNFNYGAERFLDEARVLAKFIGNKNIAGVKSYFNENNTAYFVMDYIEGISFKSYIKNKGGKVDYADALRVLMPVMDALAVVHREGFIHRDVTPDNIYITKDDETKLLDFGSARYSLGDKSKSLDVILKAGYAPKEQYIRRGKQGSYTDIYSLAACFYASITGYLPPEALERMEEDEIVPISTRGIKIPDNLENAIMKGLEVRAEDRWQSVEEFKAAIEGADASSASPVTTGASSTATSTPPVTINTSSVITSTEAVESVSAWQKAVQQFSGQQEQVPNPIEHKAVTFFKKNKAAAIISAVACLILVVSTIGAIGNNSGNGGSVVPAGNIEGAPGENGDVPNLQSDSTLEIPTPITIEPINIEPQVFESERGNTVGNIVNSGLVAERDGWVYRDNSRDDGKLYKMRTDGTERTKLSDDDCGNINVADGWVYYRNWSDNGKPYKMRTDGTERTKLSDDDCGWISVVDGWVYYCSDSDDRKLYKVRTDGTERTKLSDDACWWINVVDGWVYYSNDSDDYKLYKMHTDGTERTKISDDDCGWINVVDGWVYYRNSGDDGKLYSVRTDGTERTKLSDDNVWYINVVDGWVYYSSDSDDGKLYKMHTDGTERTKLSDDICDYINVADGWVYYHNWSDDDKIYRVRTDGTGRQLVD